MINSEKTIITQIPMDDIEIISKYLDKKIIGDELNRKIIFLGALSSQTLNVKSTNVYIRGQVSSGKSHVANKVLDLCPKTSKFILADMTPKALYYMDGFEQGLFNGEDRRVFIGGRKPNIYRFYKTCTCQGIIQATCEHEEDVLEEAQYANMELTKVIDLTYKFFLFTDAVNYDLLQMLKPLMSSDNNEMYHLATQTNGRSRTTKKTALKGTPSFIFCSANAYDKDMSETISRCVNVSVDESMNKINSVNKMISDELLFDNSNNEQEKEIMNRIENIFL